MHLVVFMVVVEVGMTVRMPVIVTAAAEQEQSYR
jgi:hypothetical protein